jgi:ABC-type transport system involved in multi-copper enzyme maturation permease subunit
VSRLWLLFRIELRKLLSRRLPWVTLVVVLLIALLSPQAGQVVDTAAGLMNEGGGAADPFQNGWTALAGAVKTARLFLVLVLLVLAGSSVAEEANMGTLKAILSRPVRRIEVLLAKVLATWCFGGLLLLLAVGAAALGGELALGLYDVVDPLFPTRVKHTHGEMATYMWLSVFLTLLPLLALTALGLLASVWFDHAGHATGVAIASLFFLSALSGLSRGARDYLFVTYLAFPFEIFDELANQISGARTELDRRLPLALTVPVAWAVLLFGLTALSFQRRDVN